MRGQVLGIDPTRQSGALIGADGARLEFPLSEWRSSGAPGPGQWVDYVLEEGQARQVFALPASGAMGAASPTPTSTVLGGLSVGCLVLGFVFPLLPTIAAFVLGLVGAQRAKAERDDTGLILSRIGWIGALVLFCVGALITISAIVFFGGLMGMLGAYGWTMPHFHWST